MSKERGRYWCKGSHNIALTCQVDIEADRFPFTSTFLVRYSLFCGSLPSLGENRVNGYAFRLYGELANTSRGNLFFSPFSISAALAMTHTGARGQTADEIRQALDLPQGNDYVYAQLGSLWKGVSGEGYLMRIANRLLGQIGDGRDADVASQRTRRQSGT